MGAFDTDPYNAFVSTDVAAFARASIASLGEDPDRPLAGVAVAVKDNVDVAGLPTGNGSVLFADSPVASADAEIVARLRAGGAEIVAKTHLTELACGTSGLNPYLGDASNPVDPNHHAGGSSSGSAIAVAAGYVPVAVGSDTGGSIRVPAAACGVVGLKPTFGRVSTRGVSACIPPLDHVGPLAADVATAAHALFVMQTGDWPDPRAASAVANDLRVAVLTGPFIETCDSDVLTNFERAIATLVAAGCHVVDLDLGLDLAEVDAVADGLGRSFHVAYGDLIRSAEPAMVSPELQMWADRYSQVTTKRYELARQDQTRLRSTVADRLAAVDVVMCPTMRSTPGLLADAAIESRAIRTGNLGLFNVTGQPSLTLPSGSGANGLPTGVLLSGHFGRDDHVLSLARTLEMARGDGERRLPP